MGLLTPSDFERVIPLSQGKFALVDAEDYEWLSQWKWHYAIGKGGIGYARRKTYLGKTTAGTYQTISVWMHRVINKTPNNLITDHINGNTLDNRRNNLRSCSTLQNNANRTKNRSKTYTVYKGVTRHPKDKKWHANIGLDHRTIYLGGFDTPELAAKAYNNAALNFFGDFAKLNFISQESK